MPFALPYFRGVEDRGARVEAKDEAEDCGPFIAIRFRSGGLESSQSARRRTLSPSLPHSLHFLRGLLHRHGSDRRFRGCFG
jgi:hypothetical protein